MQFSINPKGIQYRNTRRGVAYRATILQGDGQHMAAAACVQHRGDGGGAFVCDIEPEFDLQSFRSAAQSMFPKHGGGYAEELYIEHLMDIAEGVQ